MTKSRHRRLFYMLTAFLLAALLSLSGCRPDDSGRESATMGGISAQDGGSLKIAMGIPATLNPLLNTDKTVDDVLKLIFEPLFYPDENFYLQSDFVEEYSFDESGTKLFLTLKSGLLWQNGTPVTAHDVTFSLDTISSAAEDTYYKGVLNYAVSWAAIDELNLQINFSEMFSGNIYSLCFPVISHSYYRNAGEPGSATNMLPMGSGKYKFSSFVPAGELLLEKTTGTFGKTPLIEEIHILQSRDPDTEVFAFEQGSLDVATPNMHELNSACATTAGNVYEYAKNYFDFVAFNFTNPILSDIKVRKAIAHSLNKATVLESIYLNHARLTNSPVNPSSWLYNNSISGYDYDPDEAKALLDEAGYTGGAGMTRQKGDTELAIAILVNNENTERLHIANLLSSELRSIGFTATVDGEPYEEYKEKLYSGRYDIALVGMEFSVVPDLKFMLHSDNIGSGENFLSVSDAELDTLLDLAYNCHAQTSMLPAYQNLQEYINEFLPVLPIAFRNGALLCKNSLQGNISPLSGNIYFGIEEWYLR
ncbi:MAG: peptide ABC transporter substrate-binding protein [Firmicutes bacterium]|nr:peptide ABC transporter substrate-binding protein [Bacillota bacterium]